MQPSSTVDIWDSNICPGDFFPGDNYKLADLRDNFKHDFNTNKLSSTQLGTTQPQLGLSIFPKNLNDLSAYDDKKISRLNTTSPEYILSD